MGRESRMEKIIEVHGLQKSFGKVQAVCGIEFCVERGKLFAFLGPNGAGKSTTIDMLCTLSRPDGGSALIDGYELGKEDGQIRKSIGVVFQDSMLDPLLTVRENLMTRARFYGMGRRELRAAVRTAAGTADVLEFLDRPYGKLSGGQRRRADIARALVHTPKILFLDEPTTGLDPRTKEGVWRTITELQRRTGMTVFLTTHYMEEAAAADHIVLLAGGKVAAMGTPYDLQERYSSDRLCVKPKKKDEFVEFLIERGVPFTEKAGVFTMKLRHTVDALPLLQQAGDRVESFEVLHGSMEDVFLNLTGGTFLEVDGDA